MVRSIKVTARRENQIEVTRLIDTFLEETKCPPRVQTKIDIAVDEIFINIASYAYTNTDKPEEDRTVEVSIEDTTLDKVMAAKITFTDSGVAYDPLEKEDPDVDLPIKDRSVGGLGIFIVKKNMDHVAYDRKDDKNVFSMIKKYS